MRMIKYAVLNTKTNERVFTNANFNKCQEVLDKMENKNEYTIIHKWLSI